jgi:hypothetical protein
VTEKDVLGELQRKIRAHFFVRVPPLPHFPMGCVASVLLWTNDGRVSVARLQRLAP